MENRVDVSRRQCEIEESRITDRAAGLGESVAAGDRSGCGDAGSDRTGEGK